eukprot:148896-Hanusia_phi.AAC.1
MEEPIQSKLVSGERQIRGTPALSCPTQSSLRKTVLSEQKKSWPENSWRPNMLMTITMVRKIMAAMVSGPIELLIADMTMRKRSAGGEESEMGGEGGDGEGEDSEGGRENITEGKRGKSSGEGGGE